MVAQERNDLAACGSRFLLESLHELHEVFAVCPAVGDVAGLNKNSIPTAPSQFFVDEPC